MSVINNDITMKSMSFNNYDIKKWIHDGIKVFVKEITDLTPVLTSDTSSSVGTASCSSYFDNSSSDIRYAWKAFDDSDSTEWFPDIAEGGHWVQFAFNTSNIVTKAVIKIIDGRTGVTNDITIYLQGSNDGSKWTTLKSFSPSDSTVTSVSGQETIYTHTFDSLNDECLPYKYYRLYSDGNWYQNNVGFWGVTKMQLYGYEL